MNETSMRLKGPCELCQKNMTSELYPLPSETKRDDSDIALCSRCLEHFEEKTLYTEGELSFLNEAIWSEVDAVKVLAWRVLNQNPESRLSQDLLSQIYLDDSLRRWAEEGLVSNDDASVKDAHGNSLKAGDTVTLIKDLDVKGTSMTAKRGTIVKRISLTDNPLHIEGRIQGISVVLVAKFLKKS